MVIDDVLRFIQHVLHYLIIMLLVCGTYLSISTIWLVWNLFLKLRIQIDINTERTVEVL